MAADSGSNNPNLSYKHLDYSHYDEANEFDQFYLDRKAISDVPVSGINYVFFTAPDLTLTENRLGGTNPFYSKTNVINNNRKILKLPMEGAVSMYTDDIVRTLSGEHGTFMKIISNRCSSLPASSTQLATLDYGETWNKYKIVLGTNSKDSKISGNFELALREDHNLTLIKLHKLWMDYIENVFMGRVVSNYANTDDEKCIDYLASVYTFSLKPDGRTIQHWSKYTGVFPTKVPYEIFASEDGDYTNHGKVHFEYQFAYKEDMDVAILRDFNLLTQANLSNSGSEWRQHANEKSAYNDYAAVARKGIPVVGGYDSSRTIGSSPVIVQNRHGEFELILENSKEKYGYRTNRNSVMDTRTIPQRNEVYNYDSIF